MFPIGSTIQLEGFLDKRKLRSVVIGWSENEYVVIGRPTVNGEPVLLPKDAAVVCRGLIEGRSYGFKSHVLHMIEQPFPYLFLVYPKDFIELSPGRGSGVEIHIPAKLVPGKGDGSGPDEEMAPFDATVVNVSMVGCMVTMEKDLNPALPVYLSFQLPTGDTVKHMKGQVRDDISLPEGVSFGIQFDEADVNVDLVFEFVRFASRILSQTEIN